MQGLVATDRYITIVPIASPSIILARFPGLFISKTTNGISLSMHIVNAVESITLRRRVITSSKEILSNF